MRITALRRHLMQAGPPSHTAWTGSGRSALATGRNWLFVAIETDAGLIGIGEGSGWPRVVSTAIEDFAPLLVGECADDIERLSQKLRVAAMGHGDTGVVGMGAIAAIDVALWDLKAQALGVALVQLLGGKVRERVPYYVHASDVDTATAAVRRGVRALKVGGLPGVVERAHAIREAVGADVDLVVDLHGPPWLCAADAIAIGRALEPLDLLFLEEPVAHDDLPGWRRVRDAVALPLAGGERLATLAAMRPFVSEGLVDIVQPDTGRFGGITQMRKLAGFAEAHGVAVAPHSGSLGPVAEFAAVHLLAAIPNGLLLERLEPDWPLRDRVVTHPLATGEGFVDIPERAGLGTGIDADLVAQYPSERNVAIPSGGFNAGTEGETPLAQPRRPRARAVRRSDRR